MQLDGENPFVFLGGQHTKNHEDAQQPIPESTAKQFAEWKASLKAKDGDPVFANLTTRTETAQILQKDLVAMMEKEQEHLPADKREKIEQPVCDHAGRKIDFHSLRNSYITFLADSNTPAKVIQKLARHSTMDLTFRVYARPVLSSERKAVAELPNVETDAAAKTAAV